MVIPRAPGKRLASCLASLGAVGLLNACVVGAEGRASRPQVAAGPPAQPLRQGRASSLLATAPGVDAPRSEREETAPPSVDPGRVQTAGYYHWNGVRYVYQAPRSESVAPGFRWR